MIKPQINIKKLYCEQKRSELKNLPQVKFLFTLVLHFSTFCNSFKLLQRTFHGGSIMLFGD